ncbi:mannosyl-oligosaccharide 1,3-1,6-alpha-mannosidase activity protein [Coemansia biformis]|uniref:Mannosyl-oligosaccharide 1,3-1,6-alpha-mannosidase activity protein n=1 Tax=Coemansia biformis TaxID=1286918 RepID=A0A9W8CY31_9FUNG|nr:mannosyl-oligosaccharide 1,3-1,6-alpha-mannosidase activity protein [Coemansia biformis]
MLPWLALLAVLLLVLYANQQVLPVQKASWMPRFGEPGPPTARELPQRHPLPRNLTVHILPHSHSDIGWNLSFEGYYRASVHEVMRRVVVELWADRQRRFTWGDLAFLDLWMGEEGDVPNGRLAGSSAELTWRQVVKELVSRGQWEIVGGTYVNPDEGMTSWWAHNMIVDVGHRVLAREFNMTTSVGWQIDSFGHTNTLAHVLSNAGYQTLMMSRMSYRDKYDFASHSDLQFLWLSGEHHAAAAGVDANRVTAGRPLLVHFLTDHYAYPSKRFDFDKATECDTGALLNELLLVARRHVRQYPAHGHVLIMMGDDFRYVKAAHAFSCLDSLMAASRGHKQWADVTLRYSTVSDYFGAVRPYMEQIDGRVALAHASDQQRQEPSVNRELRLHSGDFYPYQDKPYEQYWSGILASRPYLKWLIRNTEQIVQHVEALVAMLQIRENARGGGTDVGAVWAVLEEHLEYCRKQVAISYHHDAITGTCTDQAFGDYARRLRSAARVALSTGQVALRRAAGGSVQAGAEAVDQQLATVRTTAAGAALGYNTATRDAVEPERDALEVPAALCGPTQCDGATIVVTNANLLVPQDQVVRMRVHAADAALVDLATGKAVPDVQVQAAAADGMVVVEFLARGLPGFGLRSFALGNGTRFPGQVRLGELLAAHKHAEEQAPAKLTTATLYKGGVHVRLTAMDNGAVRIESGKRRVVHQLRQYFANPFVQASGAYVMHSFMLMYGPVFWLFGAALCSGLAAGWAVHVWAGGRGGMLRVVRLPRVSIGRGLVGRGGAAPVAAATAAGGCVVGVAFVYYAAQVASVDRLNDWTRGQGLATLVPPVFACAYVASGAFRWRLSSSALLAHGVAAGVALALLLGRTWQSRPVATAPLFFGVEHGAVCDRVRAHVAVGIEVEFMLCADAPDQLQVVSRIQAPADREIVGRFSEAGETARELAIFDGVSVRRRSAGRWTPIPGTFYPAPSHVALGRLVVHARQTMGASCIAAGTLELMMHRSMTANDFRGLLQPLTDNTPAVVAHIVDLQQSSAGAGSLHLSANERINAPPLAFVLPTEHTLPAMHTGAAQAGVGMRLVGIRAHRAGAEQLQVEARIVAHEPVDVPAGGILRGAGSTVEAQGDWSLCELSAGARTFAAVDRVRLARGQQKLLWMSFPAGNSTA